MAWITDDGASTINLAHSSGSSSMFRLKKLLKTAGWTVLASADGLSYSSSSDIITSDGVGAGGLDNASSWFRITDPDAVREYVFQRGAANSYSWAWLYSAGDKFTGGSPDATTRPTATDEKGLARASSTVQTIFPTSGSWVTHLAAQTSEHNGVYAWWLCVYDSAEEALLLCDAIDSESTSNDNDPCVHYGSDDTATYSNFANETAGSNPDGFRGWLRYGESDEAWSGFTALYYTAYSSGYWPNPAVVSTVTDPHDNLMKAPAMHVYRPQGISDVYGYKGRLKYTHWNPSITTETYTDLTLVGTNYWLVWGPILLPGWPDSTAPAT